jgi:ATP-binding cassette subfamily F protein 3
MLTVDDLRHSFQAQPVLEGASFVVNPGDRAALIGRNGSGKTTLLRLIAGEDEPEGGSIRRLPGIRLGYLRQDARFSGEHTLEQEVSRAFEYLRPIGARLQELEARMSDAGEAEMERILEEYGGLQHRYEQGGGYDSELRVRTVLFGLGFREVDLEKPATALSGGEQTRASLARLLLEEPDLLLLDEPTNHLDLYAVEWLEGFLSRWKGAFLLVSHDRTLIDTLATVVIELEGGKTTSYPGNYSAYERQKAAALAVQQKQFEQQQEKIRRLEDYIRRYQAGNRATMAKSREKALARIERVERPRHQTRGPSIRFSTAAAGGREVLRVRDLTKRIGERTLFAGVELTLERGERLALIGPNGSGKSTLLKITLGMVEPDAGDVEWGYRVEPGYFAQDLSTLDEENTILDELMEDAAITIHEARSLLGRFLFTADDVFKSIAVLSGGERNRVALAKLFLARPNVLVLDEPTNHLDIVARGALEEALLAYDGTVIFASHDRHLLDRVGTSLLEVAGGRATLHRGTYHELRERQEAQRRKEAIAAQKAAAKRAAVRPPAPGAPRRTLKRVETEVHEAETRLADLLRLLADPAVCADAVRTRALLAEYEALNPRLEELLAEWEALAEAQ